MVIKWFGRFAVYQRYVKRRVEVDVLVIRKDAMLAHALSGQPIVINRIDDRRIERYQVIGSPRRRGKKYLNLVCLICEAERLALEWARNEAKEEA